MHTPRLLAPRPVDTQAPSALVNRTQDMVTQRCRMHAHSKGFGYVQVQVAIAKVSEPGYGHILASACARVSPILSGVASPPPHRVSPELFAHEPHGVVEHGKRNGHVVTVPGHKVEALGCSMAHSKQRVGRVHAQMSHPQVRLRNEFSHGPQLALLGTILARRGRL